MSSKLNNIHSLLRVDYEHTHQYFIHITKLLHTSDYSGSHTYTHTHPYTPIQPTIIYAGTTPFPHINYTPTHTYCMLNHA